MPGGNRASGQDGNLAADEASRTEHKEDGTMDRVKCCRCGTMFDGYDIGAPSLCGPCDQADFDRKLAAKHANCKRMKTHERPGRRAWYDPHLRLWTLQKTDPAGNQVGEVDYTPERRAAMAWLAAATTKQRRTER